MLVESSVHSGAIGVVAPVWTTRGIPDHDDTSGRLFLSLSPQNLL